MLGNCKELLDATLGVIAQSRAVQLDSSNPQKQQGAERERKKWNATLGNLRDNTLAVDTKDINLAIDNINRAKDNLTSNSPSRKQFTDASDDLEKSLRAANATIAQLSAVAKNNPAILAQVAKMTGGTIVKTLDQASIAASSAVDRNLAAAILAAARALADSMNGLMKSALYLSANKTPQTLRNLEASSNEASLAIAKLGQSLGTGSSSPEVAQAMKQIMDTIQGLDNNSLTISAASATANNRESLLANFLALAKDLARATGGLVQASRGSAQQHAGLSQQLSRSACDLLLASGSVGSGNGPTTPEGQTIFKATEAIISNPVHTQTVATNVKKIMDASSGLISHVHDLASQLGDGNAGLKDALVQAAPQLVEAVTALTQATRETGAGRSHALAAGAKQVQAAVLSLEKLMGSSEDELDPAVVSKLKSASRAIGLASHEVIRASAVVNSDPNNADHEMNQASKMLSESIKGLMGVVQGLNPAAAECDKALQEIQKASLQLDAANFAASLGTLHQHLEASSKPLQEAREESANLATQVVDDLSAIRDALSSPQDLKVAVARARVNVPRLLSAVKDAAGASPDQATQMKLLSSTKTATDSILQLIRAARAASTNDRQGLQEVPATLAAAQSALGALLNDLQSSVSAVQDLDKVMRAIKEAVDGLRNRIAPSSSYRGPKNDSVNMVRELLGVLLDLVRVDKSNTGQIGLTATRVSNKAVALIKVCHLCACTTTDPQSMSEILSCTSDTGISTLKQLMELKKLMVGQSSSSDQFEREFDSTRDMLMKLVGAIKKGAVGERMLEQAIKVVSDSIALLNTASIFDEAGQLEEHQNTKAMTIQNLQQSLQAMVQKFAEQCTYIGRVSQAGSDEDLGTGAVALAEALKKIANICVATASKLHDAPLSRKELLTNGKLVALANSQMLLSAKSYKLHESEATREALGTSISSVVRQLKQLLGAIQQIGRETAQTIAEIDASIKALLDLITGIIHPTDASIEEVHAAAKEVLVTAAELMFAPTREDVVSASKDTVYVAGKLLSASKGVAATCTDRDVARTLDVATKEVANSIVSLMETSKLPRSDAQTQPQLEAAGAKVTLSINNVIDCLRKFPNALPEDIEEEDLDSLAEQELMKCAQIIENAAKMLLSAQNADGMVDLSQLNEAIIQAARQIALATAELVKQSIFAQRERVQYEKSTKGGKYHVDPMWTNGLISASQQVARSVQELVNQANSAATGSGTEEALVASSRAVAAATAHLLSASRAKADNQSPTQQRLGQAAKAVAQAGSKLVVAAQTMRTDETDNEDFTQLTEVRRKKVEMDTLLRIKEVEARLDAERIALGKVHAQKYK